MHSADEHSSVIFDLQRLTQGNPSHNRRRNLGRAGRGSAAPVHRRPITAGHVSGASEVLRDVVRDRAVSEPSSDGEVRGDRPARSRGRLLGLLDGVRVGVGDQPRGVWTRVPQGVPREVARRQSLEHHLPSLQDSIDDYDARGTPFLLFRLHF